MTFPWTNPRLPPHGRTGSPANLVNLPMGFAPPDRMPPGVRFLAKPFESADLLKVVGELHLAELGS